MIIRKQGDITVVGLMERVDSETARAAEEELRSVIQGVDKSLLLDFSETKYISSAGLRVVLQVAKAMKAKGARFGVFSLQSFVHEIFETAGLTGIMDVYASEDAALAALAPKQGGAQ